MNCLYLAGNYFKSCSVSREAYVPSAFEMEEYCTSSRHSLCPFYAKRQSEYPALEREPMRVLAKRSA